jgi:hypothetical protein
LVYRDRSDNELPSTGRWPRRLRLSNRGGNERLNLGTT